MHVSPEEIGYFISRIPWAIVAAASGFSSVVLTLLERRKYAKARVSYVRWFFVSIVPFGLLGALHETYTDLEGARARETSDWQAQAQLQREVVGLRLAQRQPAPPTTVAPSRPVPSVRQETHGENSPNIYAPGNKGTLTLNPPVNPYAPVVTHSYQGIKRTSAPGKLDADGSLIAYYERLTQLEARQDCPGIMAEADRAIAADPKWLTPYVFKGVAFRCLGDIPKALEMFQYVASKSQGNPEYDRIREAVRTAPR